MGSSVTLNVVLTLQWFVLGNEGAGLHSPQLQNCPPGYQGTLYDHLRGLAGDVTCNATVFLIFFKTAAHQLAAVSRSSISSSQLVGVSTWLAVSDDNASWPHANSSLDLLLRSSRFAHIDTTVVGVPCLQAGNLLLSVDGKVSSS